MYPWSYLRSSRVVIDSIFVYHFVDPDLRVEIFFERGDSRKWKRWFWNRGYRHLWTLVLEVEGNFMQGLFFTTFWVTKKIALKALLTCTFIRSLLNSFDLPSYSSESRKRYTLRLLLMCPEVLEEGFSCFPGRDWEGVCRKLLFLVRLYQRFWIWNTDKNLNMALLIANDCTTLF